MKAVKICWDDGAYSLVSIEELRSEVIKQIEKIEKGTITSGILYVEIVEILPREFANLHKKEV